MSRVLHWDDRYCPNGHAWQFVPASGLYPDYYYCTTEDLIWRPTVEVVIESDIVNQYNPDRPWHMKEHAKFFSWLESLTPKDMEIIMKATQNKE